MPNSPIDPLTWFMSLAFVVAVTMVKQGYEDYLRWGERVVVNGSIKVTLTGYFAIITTSLTTVRPPPSLQIRN